MIMDYYEKFEVSKINNENEMDIYLEISKLLKVTKEELDNLNSSVSFKVVEFLLKNFPPCKKLQGQMVPLLNSTQHLRKK